MEFINYEKLHRKYFCRYVTKQEIAALEQEITSTEIASYEHEMNNSFVDLSFGKTIDNLRKQNYNFIGIGKAPYPHHDWHWAIVFEDNTTFEKYWCHIDDYLVDDWREEKGKYA